MTQTQERVAGRAGVASAARDLTIRRIVAAPRPIVFRVWTERERLLRWFGPRDFTTSAFDSDLRVGGAWHARMRSPQGTEYPQHGVVRELVPPERFAFTLIWNDQPSHEMLVTVAFAERNGQTEMTFRQSGFESDEQRDSHEEGWNESFDRLDEYIAGRR